MQAVPAAAHDGLIELELWMVVNHHMAAGNQTLVPARKQMLLTIEPALPHCCFAFLYTTLSYKVIKSHRISSFLLFEYL